MSRNLWSELNALTVEERARVLEDVESYTDGHMEDRYRDMLNDCYEPVSICGYEYEPARALEAVDPVAYRCGFSDYVGTDETVVEWSGTYYDADELAEALDDLEEEKEASNDAADQQAATEEGEDA